MHNDGRASGVFGAALFQYRMGEFAHLTPPTVREINTRSSVASGVFGIERKAGLGAPSFFSTRGEQEIPAPRPRAPSTPTAIRGGVW